MPNHQLYRRRDNLVAVDMDGESVMMCLESGAYFSLNGSASLLWAALSTPQSADSLGERLLAAYDIDADACHRDVDAFLRQLEDKGLITPCP